MIVVVAGWIVGVAVALTVVVLDEPLDDDPVVTLSVVVEVSTSAVVPAEWPEYETAASVPKPPAAARLAIVVPIVNVRSRATARFLSAGVVGLAAFMT